MKIFLCALCASNLSFAGVLCKSEAITLHLDLAAERFEFKNSLSQYTGYAGMRESFISLITWGFAADLEYSLGLPFVSGNYLLNTFNRRYLLSCAEETEEL